MPVSQQIPEQTGHRINPWLIALIVSLATFMEVLDTTITNVSLRHIAGSMGAGEDESTWVMTSYLVANGIILPLSGWLSDTLGRKKFFVGCILGFTAASFFCGAATSLLGLVVFRVLQGAAGGGLQPTQQAIILDTFPPQKRGAVFAITGITMILAPILGPTLGGLITDNISWRWIFYINVPVGLFAALMVWRYVDDPPHAVARGFGKIDFWGLGLVAIGLAALQIVLDKGQQEDWFDSRFIMAWSVVALACLVSAVIWLWHQDKPMIDLGLFRDPAFSMSCVVIFLTGALLYGSTVLLPLMLQSQFGYSSTLAGMVLSPGGFAVMFLMPVIGKVVSRVYAKYLITIGLTLMAAGMWASSYFSPDADLLTFLGIRMGQTIGLPFLFIPASALAFSNIPKEKSNKASALYSMSRNVGGSVGIALAVSYQVRQMQLHQNSLVSGLREGNPNYDRVLAGLMDHADTSSAALGRIYHQLQQQASLLAYADCYHVFAILAASCALAGILFLPRNKIRANEKA